MKKISLKIVKYPKDFRLGYHVGETGEFEEKQSKELIEGGFAIPATEPSELPEDLPGRNHLAKAGLTLEDIKSMTDFTDVKGINKNLSEKIIEYLKPKE